MSCCFVCVQMGGVVQAGDDAIVEGVVFRQVSDPATGGLHREIAGCLKRHAYPGRDNEGERATVSNDALARARASHDAVHCSIDPTGKLSPALCAG